MIKLFLDDNLQEIINKKNKKGNTLLMIASKNGFVEDIYFFISNGADKYITNKDGNNALILAIRYDKIDNVKYLIPYYNYIEINRKNNNGNTALMMAIRYGKIDNVKLLLESKADPNIQNDRGSSALLLASGKGKK